MSFIGGYPLQPNSGETQSQLQSTISAATSGIGTLPEGVLHHPITCTGRIGFDEEGALSCAHSTVPPDDLRSHACLVHSLAIMIVEEAFHFKGMDKLPYDREP
jgi:hypothetical protein